VTCIIADLLVNIALISTEYFTTCIFCKKAFFEIGIETRGATTGCWGSWFPHSSIVTIRCQLKAQNLCKISVTLQIFADRDRRYQMPQRKLNLAYTLWQRTRLGFQAVKYLKESVAVVAKNNGEASHTSPRPTAARVALQQAPSLQSSSFMTGSGQFGVAFFRH